MVLGVKMFFIVALLIAPKMVAQENLWINELKNGKSFTVSPETGLPGRMWLNLVDDNRVLGVYSQENSHDKELLGTLSKNTLNLNETVQGQSSGRLELKIEQSTQDWSGFRYDLSSQKLPVLLTKSEWIWLSRGRWISPAKLKTEPHDRCQVSQRWPQFVGLTTKTNKKINKLIVYSSALQNEKFCRQFLRMYPPYKSFVGERREDFEVLGQRFDLLSLNFVSYEYVGGAHGTSRESCRIFDLSSGIEIASSSLIDQKKKLKLRALIEQSLISQFKQSKMNSLSIKELGIDEKAFNKAMKLPKLCFLGLGKGGYIYFGQGEIGPMVWGIPRVALDEKQLKEVLLNNEKTRALFFYQKAT